MILYTLACESGHRFESWFRDSAAYDEQIARGLVSCATCHSTHVNKTIMAPAIMSTRAPVVVSDGAPEVASAVVAAPVLDVALLDDKSRALRALLRSVRDKVVSEGQDVGADFADEARRIHEGQTPARQIYGQASPTEARDLLEDGILILPMPIVPDELN